jgi:hypothetical protein
MAQYAFNVPSATVIEPRVKRGVDGEVEFGP